MAAHGLETQSRDDSDDWSGWDEWLQQEGDEPIVITPPAAVGFDPTAPVETPSEADLDEALSVFDAIQADLNYQQARTSLSALINRLDLKETERAGLEAGLEDLSTMLQKLEEQVIHIAVFGMVSRGKSSLLNALLRQSIFATGPVHGVTQHSQQTQWTAADTPDPEDGDTRRISLKGLGRSRVELIDTPGIDEIDGQQRETMARTIAKQADLILFVIAGDMTRVEYEALAELRNASKPILLVFNKIDQYPDTDRDIIYRKIRDERVRSLLSPEEIVMAAAAPLVAQPVQNADGSWRAELVAGPPQVTDLKLKILEVLHREGKALVALNTLLYADDIHDQVLARKLALRDQEANRMIGQSAVAKALAIALNPITVVDIVSSAVVDVALIVTLAKLYGLPMTQQDAAKLVRNIVMAMGSIGAAEFLTTLGLSSVKGALSLAAPVTGGASLVPYLSVATAQAAAAGVSSYAMGQVAKRYLANGATWGPDSPKTVVQEILDTMDQTYILNRIKTELKAKLQPKTAPNFSE